jgi:hypothetical protein
MGLGGVVASDGNPNGRNYTGGLTFQVLLAAFVAASGGLIFGYDIGITGRNSFIVNSQQS